MKKLMLATVGAVALLAASPANAAPTITFDLLEAAWYGAVGSATSIVYDPAENTLSEDTVKVSWGTAATTGGQSGYEFDAEETPFTEGPDVQFDLGLFTHNNLPIFSSGGSITSVNLRLVGDLTVLNTAGPPTVAVSGISFLFRFDHNETPNAADPCADGESRPFATGSVNVNGCADQVTITSLANTGIFTVDGEEFTLAIDGFRLHSNNEFVNEFWTIEEQSNQATLVGSFTSEIPVPEPGTLALLGIGLLGAGFAARRRHAAS